ncbi:MAG: alpha/beta fold hydrolase [Lactimicrobium sp.]|jgi:lysophospholipase|uniref:alpha/beta fold hydrolase n=1 Tax=Lactimicrobium sp. TaxID=2563780 RepID=UPI002F359002
MSELEEKTAPWIAEHAIQQEISSFDGVALNTYHAIPDHAKAVIVMVHGFCGFFGKYHELFMHFYQAGYAPFFLELRGHGKSGNRRSFADKRVTVGSFEEYTGDVHAFVSWIKKQYPDMKRFLFAHSMGGAAGALELEEHPDDFACAVLSSPMLAMNFGKLPEPAVDALSVYAKVKHLDDDFAPGQHAWDDHYDPANSSCDSEKRYAYQFHQREKDPSYQTWGGTYGWARAAKQGSEKALQNAGLVKVPVLICQAERDTMVLNEGEQEFKKRSANTAISSYDSRHEIFAANDDVFEKYVKDVLTFYDVQSKKLEAKQA